MGGADAAQAEAHFAAEQWQGRVMLLWMREQADITRFGSCA